MKKKNNKGTKLLEGALIGAALGVAAEVLAESKLGKEIEKEMKTKSAQFYKYIAPKLKKAKQMGEEEYKIFLEQALERFTKDKKLSQSQAKHLLEEVKSSWNYLKKHL